MMQRKHTDPLGELGVIEKSPLTSIELTPWHG